MERDLKADNVDGPVNLASMFFKQDMSMQIRVWDWPLGYANHSAYQRRKAQTLSSQIAELKRKTFEQLYFRERADTSSVTLL